MSVVLVLNCDYTPLNVTSQQRGFVLVHKGKAEVIKSDKNPISTSIETYVRPLIIRLLNYIQHRAKKLKINRQRVYRRDSHQCVYCGSKRDLTLDHVIPKSRGGSNGWENLVTSCARCNTKKADRTPEEANMKMAHKPYIPSLIEENYMVKSMWDDFQRALFVVC